MLEESDSVLHFVSRRFENEKVSNFFPTLIGEDEGVEEERGFLDV